MNGWGSTSNVRRQRMIFDLLYMVSWYIRVYPTGNMEHPHTRNVFKIHPPLLHTAGMAD